MILMFKNCYFVLAGFRTCKFGENKENDFHPFISVILLNYNGLNYLPYLFKSIEITE
jgi:hypothetical protein